MGSVYVLLAAIYGRKMGYFVLMVGFFGWMIVLSGLWVVGSGPLKVSGEAATLPDLGPARHRAALARDRGRPRHGRHRVSR